MKFLVLITLFGCMLTQINGQIDRLHCRNPLGMQDKRIPDSHLSASSYHARGTGPNYARLEREEGDGAWCPKGLIQSGDQQQYLQVWLPHLSFLSVVATQGRHANGKGQEFMPSYKLNYSRDGETWLTWKNFRGSTILTGNSDTITVKRHLLNPGIPSVQYVRLIPVTSRLMTVCARIELYGCPMIAAVMKYDMPRPGEVVESGMAKMGTFDDDFYDGRRASENYFGGLGQLTDGVIGSKNIEEIKSKVPTKEIGYDYVGWRNNRNGNRYVTITFAFSDVRNFTNMRVHCASSSAIEAKFFSNVQVSFSLNGRTFSNNPYSRRVAYEVPENATPTDNTRFVVVPLGRAMARYVRARFLIRGDWMLISEVEFDSGDVKDKSYLPREEEQLIVVSTEPAATPTNGINIGVLVGTLVGVIAILVLLVLILVYRHRRMKKTMTPPRYSYSSGSAVPGTSSASVTLCIPQQTVTLTPTPCVVPEKAGDPVYHEIPGSRGIITENEYLEPNDVVKSKYGLPEVTQLASQSGRNRRFEQPDVTMCASGVRDGIMSIPHYAETDVRAMPPPYATPQQGVFGNNLYAVPWTSPSPISERRIKQPPKPRHTPPPKYTTTPSEVSTLLAEDSQDDLGFQSMISGAAGENGAIEFPRDRLEFIEQLGEGQFGEVRLCEADASLRKYAEEEGIVLPGHPSSTVRVAVKVLREDASPNAKEDFLKEVKIMSQLRDPNIVQLLAVCTEDEPYAMITEYMEHGDLHEYLKGFDMDYSSCLHRSKNTLGRDDAPECSSTLPTISYLALMHMAAQIASGMKYLSSLNFVHRDLATRNCLIGTDHKIRIADFGMSRNMYQADYYKIQGKAVLPIRWMSWECILLGKFSTASDIWAFGVTLWEIFTLCKFQPYHSLEDQQVIENMHHIYERTGEEVYLPKPKACDARVFNMIRQCWRRETEERPSFEQLHTFLLPSSP